jgi:hypothetical protein
VEPHIQQKCGKGIRDFEALLAQGQRLIEYGELDDDAPHELMAINTHINDNLAPYKYIMFRINARMFTTYSTDAQDVHASLGGIVRLGDVPQGWLENRPDVFHILFDPISRRLLSHNLPRDHGVPQPLKVSSPVFEPGKSLQLEYIDGDKRDTDYIQYGYHLSEIVTYEDVNRYPIVQIPQHSLYKYSIKESRLLDENLFGGRQGPNQLVILFMEDSVACRMTMYSDFLRAIQ